VWLWCWQIFKSKCSSSKRKWNWPFFDTEGSHISLTFLSLKNVSWQALSLFLSTFCNDSEPLFSSKRIGSSFCAKSFSSCVSSAMLESLANELPLPACGGILGILFVHCLPLLTALPVLREGLVWTKKGVNLVTLLHLQCLENSTHRKLIVR